MVVGSGTWFCPPLRSPAWTFFGSAPLKIDEALSDERRVAHTNLDRLRQAIAGAAIFGLKIAR